MASRNLCRRHENEKHLAGYHGDFWIRSADQADDLPSLMDRLDQSKRRIILMKKLEMTKNKLSGQAALIVGIGFAHMQFSPDTAVAATGDATLGAELYNQYCVRCHGDSAIGLAKFNGELERLQFMLDGGSTYMPDFMGMFTDEEINNIHAFLTLNAE